jgi:hypothetical protein
MIVKAFGIALAEGVPKFILRFADLWAKTEFFKLLNPPSHTQLEQSEIENRPRLERVCSIAWLPVSTPCSWRRREMRFLRV